MKTVTGLSFHLVDLPPEGVRLAGQTTAEELGIESEAFIDFSEPIEYDLRLMPVGTSQDALLRGTVSTVIHAVCDRCGEPTTLAIAENNVIHEYEKAMGRIIDLTDDVREDILSVLPARFLCRDDCKGLCPYCGQNLNEGTCQCRPPVLEDDSDATGDDNPWQKLDGLGL